LTYPAETGMVGDFALSIPYVNHTELLKDLAAVKLRPRENGDDYPTILMFSALITI
jgi:hypothetical protein